MKIRRPTQLGAGVLALSTVVSLMGLSSPLLAADGAASPPVAESSVAQRAADRDEWHIRELHDKLKITAAQEPLWETVAGIMRTNDEKIDALTKERHDQAGSMTAIQDLRSYAAITAAHAEGTRSFIPAFEALYQAMPAEQQADADRVFRTVGSKSHKKAK